MNFKCSSERAPEPDRAKKEGLKITNFAKKHVGGNHVEHLTVLNTEEGCHIIYIINYNDGTKQELSIILDANALRWMVDNRIDPLRLSSTQLYMLTLLKQYGTQEAWDAVKNDDRFHVIYDITPRIAWKQFIAACYKAEAFEIYYETAEEDHDGFFCTPIAIGNVIRTLLASEHEGYKIRSTLTHPPIPLDKCDD